LKFTYFYAQPTCLPNLRQFGDGSVKKWKNLGDFVWKDTMWTVEMVTFQINLLSIAVL